MSNAAAYSASRSLGVWGSCRESSSASFLASHAAPASSRARGSAQRPEATAKMSRRLSRVWKASRTQNRYPLRSTVPSGRSLGNTWAFQPGGTTSTATFRASRYPVGTRFVTPASSRSGNARNASRTGAACAVAPNSIVSTSRRRNLRTSG